MADGSEDSRLGCHGKQSSPAVEAGRRPVCQDRRGRLSSAARLFFRSVNSGCSAGFPRLPMYDRSESVERVGRDRAFFGSSATVSIFSGRSAELQRVAAHLLRSPSLHFEFLPLFVFNTLDIHQTSFPSDALSS